ncbi:MAG: hypothetical protein WCK82_10145 [Bacteroidota bacterium]
MKQKIIILLLLFKSISMHAQETSASAGDMSTGGGGSEYYTIGQQDYSYFSSATGNINQGVQQPYEFYTVAFHLKSMLQGLYLGNGKMIASPFSADGVSPMSIADTITVELRATTSPFNVVHTVKGLLDTAGNATITFPSSVNGNSYYVVVGHRNSISAWSASPVTFSANTNYDFSSSISSAYGNNLADDGNGIFMLFSGDINQDGSVDFNDYPDLDISSSGGDLGYLPYDLNGDASVDFNDYPTLDINSNLGVLVVTP